MKVRKLFLRMSRKKSNEAIDRVKKEMLVRSARPGVIINAATIDLWINAMAHEIREELGL